MELPAMAQGLLDEEESRSWEPPIRNLDIFFTNMYQFYYAKGLSTIVLTQVCDILSLGFTTLFSSFLIGFVNWHTLTHCHDESSCGTLNDYLINPFLSSSLSRKFFIFVYGTILIAYWMWRAIHGYNAISKAIDMERFYREKLNIVANELEIMKWDDVVQKLIHLHESGSHRVAINEKLTEHDVVLRIMRKENYLIALINKSLLNLKVPWWVSPFMSEKLFLTKSLEWSLNFCVTEYMFNEQFNISSLFLKDVTGLEGRFQMVGVVHFVLLPFMLIFMMVSFFLQNAQQFHSSRAYLGPRQWSPLALWTFREFNELPHVFDERINKSYEPAVAYTMLFSDANLTALARCAAYISGAFVATLLLVSLIAEGALLHVSVSNRNLLWWLGIFSALFAGARALIPDETKSKMTPEELLTRVSSHTHYFPDHWQENPRANRVRDEFVEMFPYKITIFGMEMLSVILTPIVLCFSLPNSAKDIIRFVREHSRYVDGVGAICDYSAFDFDRYGDEQYGAVRDGYVEKSQRPLGGKMEQSFINFQATHPNWQANDAGGRALTERLNTYRMTREVHREQMFNLALQQSMAGSAMFGDLAQMNIGVDAELDSPEAKVDIQMPSSTATHKQPHESESNFTQLPTPPMPATVNPLAPSRLSVPASSVQRGVWSAAGYHMPGDGSGGNGNGFQSNANASPLAAVKFAGVAESPIRATSDEMSTNPGSGVELTGISQRLRTRSNFSSKSPLTMNAGSGVGSPRRAVFPGSFQSSQLGNSALFGFAPEPDSCASVFGIGAFANSVMGNSRPMNSSALLRSVLRQENIDYENDFYWLNQLKRDRKRDPAQLERSLSLQQSALLGNSSLGLLFPNEVFRQQSGLNSVRSKSQQLPNQPFAFDMMRNTSLPDFDSDSSTGSIPSPIISPPHLPSNEFDNNQSHGHQIDYVAPRPNEAVIEDSHQEDMSNTGYRFSFAGNDDQDSVTV